MATSLKFAWAMPSISRRKRKLRSGSVRGMSRSPPLSLRFRCVLEHAEDDEFRRPHRRDSNLANQPAVEDVVLRHRRTVAGDEEGLVFGAAEQRAFAPLRAQEEPDGVLDACPQPVVVRLEDD